MVNVEIRRIRSDEAVAHREIRLRALADAPLAFGTTHAQASARPPEWWQSRTKEIATSERSALFVADGRDGLLGLLGVELEEPGRAEFISMWVAPEARGTGLGQQLMNAASVWASERGIAAFELWVTEGNEHAIALYQAYGFVFSGETRPHPSQPQLREIQMRRGG